VEFRRRCAGSLAEGAILPKHADFPINGIAQRLEGGYPPDLGACPPAVPGCRAGMIRDRTPTEVENDSSRFRSMTVLITGGAGYIGSHAVLAFQEAGYAVAVVDDLSTGRREAVPEGVPFFEGDAGDQAFMQALLESEKIASVIHFAGSLIVPESLEQPLAYYRNNTAASRNLTEACVQVGVRHFIFSSTCAVYGVADRLPVSEEAPTNPINPYGRSKLMTEWILADASQAHDFSAVSLRYFNVAGADPEGRTGQSTPKATQLIKVACEAVVGLRDGVTVFGDDYDTPDGTCIRDYIHVSDLADAHVAALRYLEAGGRSRPLNCGYGHGFSVREVLDTVKRVAGYDLVIRPGPRRPGDPPALFADVSQSREALGWRPARDDLSEIVASALRWEKLLQENRASDA
jgi:UDP-glucose 4-epimerase